MELILFAAVCLLGVVALRWGHDSRLPPESKEQDLASLGMSWQDDTATVRSTRRKAATAALRPVER